MSYIMYIKYIILLLMFIYLDSKYSLKHIGHFQLFILLYSPDKILCAPCVRYNIGRVALL